MVACYPDGKAETISLSGQNATSLLGLKINDEFDGSILGKPEYVFTITGGSDSAGFPMVKHIQGGSLIRVMGKDKQGLPKRVLRRGSLITESVVQVNVVAKKRD